MTETFDCPNCGAPMDYQDHQVVLIRCPYCSSSVIVPEALRSVTAREPDALMSPETVDSGNLLEQAAQFAEIANLIRSGRKIEAIKNYRELTGLGLQEAKEAVQALEAGRPVTLIASSLPDNTVSGQPDVGDPLQSQGLSQAAQVDVGLLKKVATGVGTGIGCYATLMIAFILAFTLIPIFFSLALPGGPLFETWTRINPLAANKLVMSFGQEGSGPGFFQEPRHIALDDNGDIYVADYRTGRIQRFDKTGSYQSVWNLENQPYVQAIATSREGKVYVVHSGRIFIYDGQEGRFTGEVQLPDENSIYVDDLAIASDGSVLIIAEGERLIRLDPSGQIKLDIPDAVSSVSGDSELDTRVALDGLGNIFLLGTFNSAVFKYSPTGTFLTRFGGSGDDPGLLRAASAIGVDSHGRVYVSDTKGVQVFDNEGRFLDLLKIDGHAFGLATDDENLYLITNKPRVYKYSLEPR